MENRRLPRSPIDQMLKILPLLLGTSIPRRIQQILAWYSWEASDMGGVKTGSISTTWEFLSRYRALQNPRIPPKLIFSMPVASNKENDWQMKLLDNNSDVENQIMLSRSSSSRQQSDKSWTIVGQSGENWENGTASGRRKGPAVILTNLSDS